MYIIRLKKPAEKYLNKLSGKIYRSIRKKLEDIKTNPVPSDAEPMTGYSNTYRIRTGNLRIIYEVRQRELVIIVIDIGPRGQIYNPY